MISAQFPEPFGTAVNTAKVCFHFYMVSLVAISYYTQNNFDLIVLKDVIEHFSKKEIITLINRIYLRLNKNGVLIIQTVNGQSPFFGIRGFGDLTHKTILTPRVLKNLLNKYNFRTIEIFPVRPQIYNISSLFRKLLFFVFELLFKLFLVAENGTSNYIVTQNFVIRAKK